MQGYKTAITDFYFLYFGPKNSKKCFEDIILKVPVFFKMLKKPGIYVVVLLVCYRHAKFELGNSFF